MDYEQILYEKVGRIAKVTLNRPQYRNALSRILLEELDAALQSAAEDPDIRVVTLFGAGEHFSAGHDLGTPEKLADDEARPYEDGMRGGFKRGWDQFIEKGFRMRNLPKPTIAGVQGYCIFGGWMVASAMDIIFAADDAQFLGSKFQYFAMPWDIGIRKTKEIIFEGRFIDAAEAQELGFVNRVVPRSELEAEVMAYAERVAEHDSFSLRLAKLATNQAQDAQGYTSAIVDAHSIYHLGVAESGRIGSQGAQMPSGQRRLANVPDALEKQRLARGHRHSS